MTNECWIGLHDNCSMYEPPMLNCECECHMDIDLTEEVIFI